MEHQNKKYVYWLCVTAVIMVVLPFAVARLASECSGMALCMMLFFIINPVYSVILGLNCGRNIRRMWSFPLISSITFLAGCPDHGYRGAGHPFAAFFAEQQAGAFLPVFVGCEGHSCGAEGERAALNDEGCTSADPYWSG